MSTTQLKERLIDRIREIDNEDILAEAYRLLGMETDAEEPFKLNAGQKEAVQAAREQIKNGSFITNKDADKEIDEWLKM